MAAVLLAMNWLCKAYVVLAADTLGWGERGPLTYDTQQALAANFLQLGRSLAGFAAYEDLRLAAFLKQLPATDASKIAAVGFSMGAFRAWQLSALTDDIQAAAAISWMTTTDTTMTPGNNQLRGQTAFWIVHPGLAASWIIRISPPLLHLSLRFLSRELRIS
ncbi:dienelactone hydrolase family protein [Alishewanella longhuensis]